MALEALSAQHSVGAGFGVSCRVDVGTHRVTGAHSIAVCDQVLPVLQSNPCRVMTVPYLQIVYSELRCVLVSQFAWTGGDPTEPSAAQAAAVRAKTRVFKRVTPLALSPH